MAWPIATDVKAQFEKLNDSALDAKITQALAFAVARVKSAFASDYNVAGWAASTPPLIYQIALYLTYGYFAPRAHTGAKLSASDEAAKDARDYAEDLLKRLAAGELALLDSSDALIPRYRVEDRTGLAMLTKPVFGVRDPEQWGITRPSSSDGTEWT